MPDRAQSFEDHYRTRDDQLLFLFRFRCDAGSSTWRFAVKYGDIKMTYAPSSFHDPGLVLQAESREELLDEAARWAEAIHAFYNQIASQDLGRHHRVVEADDANC